MNEIPHFEAAENEPTPPDNHELSQAIARRIVGDHCKMFAGNASPDLDPSSFPAFFMDSQVNAMAKSINSALKTPSPFAAFFDSSPLVIDGISNGDALAFVEETDIEDSSPRQVMLYGKALLLATNRTLGPSAKLPEAKYQHFMAMVQDADEMAEEYGIEKPAIYSDDKLYSELIRRNISQDDYQFELEEYISELTFDKFVDFVANLVSFVKQVTDNPGEVDASGFTIDDDEILKERKNLEDDPFFLDEQKDNYDTAIDQSIDQIAARIKAIWE